MRRSLARGIVITLAVLAAGCGGGASSTGGSTAAADPACSHDAILAAVKNEADVQDIGQFACSGDWAYTSVITSGPDGIEYTDVLQRDGDGWKSVDREAPCKDHSVPADIYQAACETN
jgi:hypothetical protein